VMYGFVAQELKDVIPQMVSVGGDGYYWYNPSGFESILTAGVQEQQGQIASLSEQFHITNNRDMAEFSQIREVLTLQSRDMNREMASLSFRIEDLEARVASMSEGFEGLGALQQEGNIGTGAKTFWTNLFERVTAWFADAGNGIVKFFVKELYTEKLCVKKSDGTDVCVTGDELDALISGGGTANSVNSTPIPEPEPEPPQSDEDVTPEESPESDNGASAGQATPEPTPESTPETTPEPTPTPEVTPTPTPEIQNENTE